jgi:hypothetical protein
LPGASEWEKLGHSTGIEIQTKQSNVPNEQPSGYDRAAGWIHEEQKSGF